VFEHSKPGSSGARREGARKRAKAQTPERKREISAP